MTDDKRPSTLTPGMKIVIAVVAMLVLAGVVVVSTLLSAGGAPGPAPATTQQGGASSGGSSTGGPQTPGAASRTPARGPLPQATPTTGSEVLPPTATPQTHIPKITPAPPLVTAPLPKPASRQGGLVKGYPTRVMGPVAASDVVSSSVATQGSTMQATLVAVAATSPKDITAHYATLWSSLGLRRSTTNDGTVVYTGAHESVTLAFASAGTGNRYTIYGVFRTK